MVSGKVNHVRQVLEFMEPISECVDNEDLVDILNSYLSKSQDKVLHERFTRKLYFVSNYIQPFNGSI